MAVCEVPREYWHDRMDLGAFVSGRRHAHSDKASPQRGLVLGRPSAPSPAEQTSQYRRATAQHVGSEIYRGVLTGCNEAFYISEETRQTLWQRTTKSADLIKSQLRGQDIGRWRPSPNAVYVIFARRGTKIELYPAVLHYLDNSRTALNHARPIGMKRQVANGLAASLALTSGMRFKTQLRITRSSRNRKSSSSA